jgi:hypothetical protein
LLIDCLTNSYFMNLSTLIGRKGVPPFYTWNNLPAKALRCLMIFALIGLATSESLAQDPPCLVDYSLTADPAPDADTYEAGQEVTFTFEVIEWDQTNANWFHAAILSFGDGWDVSTLSTTAPASCDGQGEWAYFDAASDPGTTYGQGFYYDSDSGGPFDGDPLNNYGDNCSGTWTFEFSLTVGEDCPDMDLSVGINTTGDSETGSWSSGACDADPEVNFAATNVCADNGIENDECDGAIALECGASIIGSTVGAENDDVEFCGTTNGTGGGVWYSIEGDGSLVTATTCSAITNYDSKLRVYTGPCDALECVVGDDDDFSCPNSGLQSTVDFTAENGVTYYILVHGFAANEGDFELSITCTDCPGNDAPCDAIALDLDVPAVADNRCATADDGEVTPGSGTGGSSCNSTDGWCSFETAVQNSIWFTFVAPDCGGVNIATGYLGLIDWQLAVYSVGDCGDYSTFAELGGNDDSGIGLSPALELEGLTPGETYYVQVDGFSGTSGIDEILVSSTQGELTLECPADTSIECGTDDSPAVTGVAIAGYCDEEVEVDYEDEIVDLDCGYEIHRTWFPALLDDNFGGDDEPISCTQIITVVDTTDPFFTFFPEDFEVECGLVDDEGEMLAYLEANTPAPVAADACGDVDGLVEWEWVDADDCPIVGYCLKHVTIEDECGNSITQTLTVTLLDTEGPVFEDYEDPINVSCLEEVPGPADLMAYDDCMNEYVDVEIFESNTGELTDTCNLSVAFGPGDDWALWLPVLFADGKVSSANFVFDENGGLFEAYNDGTAHLTGTVVNDVNPSEMFELNFWFENKADWDAWSSMGRSYKDDLGCAQPDLYEAWTYYEMVNGFSTASGLGDLAGDILYFYHMPDNYYFGFQIGEGANNKNCDYGMSGWFTYYGVDAECGEFQDESDCPNDTEFTYFYRAEDNCQNATIVSQTVIVLDEIGPEFTIFPDDITVDCDEYPVDIADVAAEDNCEGDVTIVGPEDEMFPGECDNEFEVHRTWGAIDICGNRTDRTQIISVIDDEAPVMAGLPADVTVECDAIPAIPEVTATDNCSDVDDIEISFDEEEIEGDCDGSYTILRTWIAEDECGNMSDHTQEITVEDTTDPVFDAYEAAIEMPCDDISYDVDLTAQDNCSDVDVWFEDEDSDEGCAGTILRTYYAEDDCENQTSVLQTITLIDDEDPEFTAFPADDTVECDAVPAPQTDEIDYDDNCTEVSLSYDGEVRTDGDCPYNYTLVRTWTITDNCDNSTSMSQTITVQDTTAPEFTFIPQGGEYSCEEDLPTDNAEASDNCGNVIVTPSDEMIDGDCENSYTIIRTFTAEDECGNSDSVSITFFVYDETDPVFTFVAPDMTLECDEIVPGPEATATDNCDLDVEISVSPEIIEGDCPAEYTMIRTYTATDNCGNSTTATQTIIVQDTTDPEFVDYEFYTYVECEDVDDYTLEATDNCGDATVEIIEEVLNSGGCMGVLYRVYLATDECGNTTEVEQYIVITDTTAPELVGVPADETLECSDVSLGEDGNYFDDGGVTGIDNCLLDVEVTYSEEVLEDGDDCPESYIIIRTWVAVDYCENEAMAQQTVTIVDTTNPWFVEFPADDEVECSDDLPEVIMPTADDNCDTDVEIEMTIETEDGDCEGEYTLLRIFRAFDNCGNEAMMVQTIEIVDTTAPEFDYVPAAAVYECHEDIALEMATATDNCSSATVTHEDVDFADGDCPDAYSFVRVFTATDDCGNSDTATQLITVQDTTDPVFDDYETLIEMPCDDVDNTITVTATDNCDDDVTITFEDSPVSGGCAGQIIRDYTAEDNCGNTATAQQIITLTDDVDPWFVDFPADVTAECDDVPSADDVLITYDDNCTEVDLTYDGMTETPGACCGEYTIEHCWTIEDNCGNTASMCWTITVQDTTDPYFTFVPQGGEYSCDETLPTDEATADDNCCDVIVTSDSSTQPGECPQESHITITWTATDDCGNTATATTEYWIYDNEAPELDYEGGEMTLECDENVDLPEVGAADNCDPDPQVIMLPMETEPGDCENSWYEYYTWYAVDACGNESASVTLVVFYQDTTDPVFDDYETQIEMPCDDIDDTITVSATDNCDDDVTITFVDSPVSGGCAGQIIRDYTAEDNCGNTATAQQIITLTDDVDPILAGVPADDTIECGDDIPAPADVTATDNCDDDLEVIFSETTVDNDCLYTIVRTWTVTDHCDNSATATQEITIVDTTDPYFEAQNDEVTIPCDTDITVEEPEAFDACDQEVDVDTDIQEVPGDCPNEYSLIYTFTATDDCDNSAQITFTVNYVDEADPFFTSVPGDDELSCEEAIPTTEATADDNCGDAIVTSNDEIIEGDCPQAYTLIRHWLATDACGNTAEETTTYWIYDNEAPEFDQEVSDEEVECLDDAADYPVLTATDNCGIADVSMETFEDLDECGNGTILVVYTAMDECENADETSYTITINDETDPELVGDLPQDLTIDCDADAPEAPVLTATDNCGGEIEVDYEEVLIGDLPTEGSDSDCLLFTGESPYYNPDWSAWLQLFPNGDEFYFTEEAYFVEFPDGTAHLYGDVTSTSNPDAGWTIDVWMENGLGWDEWSTQEFPTSYKDDFGIAGDSYLDWTYYIINGASASMTGTGDYAGSFLSISHAPSNYYYGYQVGVAANNVNGNYGNGGWFYYEGILVEDGVTTEVDGAGDFAFDADCCPRYEIVRTWCAEDCSGNEVCHTQTITFEDLEEDPGVEDDGEVPVTAIKTDMGVDVVSIYPNPMRNRAYISFNLETEGRTNIEIFNMSGSKVLEVYNGVTEAGRQYTIEFNVGELADGLYFYRLTNGENVLTDRMIISK